MMINGDDCGMRGPADLYKHWRTITAFCGLKESIGKTYFSKSFVDINSTSFELKKEPHNTTNNRGETVQTVFQLTQYVNAGLLLGLKRSQGVIGLSDQFSANNMGVRAHELLRLAPKELHNAAMKVFINKHRETLEKTRLPWYMPLWLGGVGLPAGPWGGNSELDRRVASRILFNWKKERPIPINREELPWKTWLKAEAALPPPVFSKTKNEHTEAYSNAVSKKCIDLLFDSEVHLSDLHEELQAKGSRAIAHNAKLWKPEKGIGPELPEDKLKFQAKYPNWVDDSARLSDDYQEVHYDLD